MSDAISVGMIFAGTWCAIGAVYLSDHEPTANMALVAATILAGLGWLLAVFG